MDRNRRTELIREAIERSGVMPGPEHPCAYLQDRTARAIAMAGDLAPGTYRSLMDLNFRRSGQIFYRAACDGCVQCQAIRIPVEDFAPSRNQRRCWKRNDDIVAQLQAPNPTEEKHALYREYLLGRHTGEMDGSWDEFVQFLYNSPIETWEVEYRVDDELVGVGIFDVEEDVVSTVYCYFRTDESRRSIGTYNILWMIEYSRQRRFPHVYLGYYVQDCAAMRYKMNFRPCEVLTGNGVWDRIPVP